jgi:hypothetical protein
VPPKLRIRVGFLRVGGFGEDTFFFFLGLFSFGLVGFEGNSILAVVRLRVLVAGAKAVTAIASVQHRKS